MLEELKGNLELLVLKERLLGEEGVLQHRYPAAQQVISLRLPNYLVIYWSRVCYSRPTKEEVISGKRFLFLDPIHVRESNTALKAAVIMHKFANYYFVPCLHASRISTTNGIIISNQIELIGHKMFDTLFAAYIQSEFPDSVNSSSKFPTERSKKNSQCKGTSLGLQLVDL